MNTMRSSRAVLRVADANINRFRDGLRVVEDTLRFIHGSPLYSSARRLRGDFFRMFSGAYGGFVVSRESDKDPGRSSEQKKHSGIPSLLRANFARCSEALRVLEEYSRLGRRRMKPGLPKQSELKKIRFRLYTLEKNAARILTKRFGRARR
ncbi:MAG: hypothetical protein QME32_02865 [Endomicrobiia bacterium]|nr:hypothetical protein [Endomicrobiia bacterium]